MDHATQVALTERLLRHLDNNTTDTGDDILRHPVSVYTCPERLTAEEALLRREPLLMGLSCRLPSPGTYLTDDDTGIPILMMRDDDGVARAFINACRHRGARLAEGSGDLGPRLVCPYHAWAYDRQGNLTHAPHAHHFDGFDIAGCGLRELSVAERHGLLFVRPEGDESIECDRHLGGLASELANYGFDSYHHFETRRISCRMNWKIIIDTFLEPYHFAALHKATVAPIFVPNLCLFDAFGRNLRETLPRRTIAECRDEPRENWDLIRHSAIVYVLFPNTVFVMQQDHAEVWRCFPVDGRPDRSIVSLEFYIPEPANSDKARRHWQANMDLTVRTVEQEDFPVGEGIQRGFAAKAADHLVIGRNEPALAFFEETISSAIS